MNKKMYKLSNQETLAYLDQGQGEVYFLIHGNMSSGGHYRPLFERMNNVRLIAPDMRGFGDSTYHNRFDSLTELAEDLAELIDGLALPPLHVVGWSTGGLIALHLAATKPQHIKTVTLLESASYKGYPIYQKDASFQPIVGHHYASKESMAMDPVQVAPMLAAFENGDSEMINSIWDQAIYPVNKPSSSDNEYYISETMKQRNLLDIDWGLVTFNMSHEHNGVSQGNGLIEKVVQPVLSLWGDHDYIVPETMVDETIQALPNGKKVILKNCGHSPLVDCPDEVVNHLVAFTT